MKKKELHFGVSLHLGKVPDMRTHPCRSFSEKGIVILCRIDIVKWHSISHL